MSHSQCSKAACTGRGAEARSLSSLIYVTRSAGIQTPNRCSIPTQRGRGTTGLTNGDVIVSQMSTYVGALTPGGQYNVSVRARNSVGYGPWTSRLCRGPGAVPAPDTPTNVTATATAAAVTVAWSLGDVNNTANCTALCSTCGGSDGMQCSWTAIGDGPPATMTSTNEMAVLNCSFVPYASGTFRFLVSCSNDNATTTSYRPSNAVVYPPSDCTRPPLPPANPALVTIDR